MSECIEKLPHEECGSSDGMQVFQNEDNSYSAYCFPCSTYVSDPYGDRPAGYKPAPSSEDHKGDVEEIGRYPSSALDARGLEASALDYFGVKVGRSEMDGISPVAAHFPYRKQSGEISGYKTRLLEQKKMWSIGDIKEVELFGWREALATGGKTLFITEGEYDAVALYQALKAKSRGTQWADLNPAVVSLVNGASSAGRDLTNNLAQIRANFKEVVLVFDQDDAGEKAIRDAVDVLPTARIAGTLPAKDANACVMDGKSKALASAVLWKNNAPVNTKLVDIATLFQAGRVQAEMGLSWPWPQLTELTRGVRFGETIYLGAGVKMGKSELVNSIAAHFVTEHKLPVFMAKPEESNVKTVKMVLGKVAGKIFHDPNVPFDYEAYDQAANKVGFGMVYCLDIFQHVGWESLRGEIMVAREAGCRVVFIDPISNLVNGVPSADANTRLQEIAQDLAAMAKDLDLLVFIFCHLKSPDVGPPHERGGKVYSHQFTGSRAMARSCNLMLGFQGSKDPDLDMYDRNTRELIILEDREYGVSGSVKLFWDPATSLFNEYAK